MTLEAAPKIEFSGQDAIRLVDVHKAFSGHSVLNGVTLKFEKGKLTYILGSSGAGKSVLLKHVLGLLKPDKGQIWVGDQDITKLSHRQLAHIRIHFGMLFQNSALFDDMTVFENVAFPLLEHTRMSEDQIFQVVEKTLKILGMPDSWDKFPNQLSGGMRKRVGLARAIVREPSILLYDEPTTGLDPITRSTVDELIQNLKKELKLTSIVISHDISSALLLADRIAFIHQGKIIFYGTPQEFRKADYPLIQGFLNAERRIIDAFQV